MVQTHRVRLATVESDQAARELFLSAIGHDSGLGDVAGTLTAKRLPAKVAKELLLPDISRSAQRFVAALAAWEIADFVMQSLRDPASPQSLALSVSPTRRDWLTSNGPFPSLAEIPAAPIVSFQGQVIEPVGDRTNLALAAGRAAVEASQQAMAEWWRLKSWKDQVRALRGQTRLCGTWLWVIHDHQRHHQEQKLSLVFPSPGKEGAGISGLAETIVLGDTVYLRWEVEGKTQEDSLLFTKEGQRLEGTFVNSQGGWGSISGKRTAGCGP